MNEVISRLLSIDANEVDSVVDWSLRWQSGQWGLLAAILSVILATLTWVLYRKSPQVLGAGRRRLLTILRLGFLGLLLAVLLQPVLVLTLEREVPRSLPVLIDQSASMTLRDAGGEPGTSRLDEALAASGENEAWRTLEDEMEVSRHVFSGDSLQPIREAGPGPETEGSGDRTALGDALLKGLEQVRGSPTGGLVLLTDGGQNSGTPINHAVERLRASGIPVIAVGVGEATTRDVAVESLSVSEVLLAEDPAEVVVRLRSEGMSGENGKVILELDGVEISRQEVRFEDDGLQDVPALIIPGKEGEYILTARVDADTGGEALDENNTLQTPLKVVDRRLRVLLVDQAPRWEYKYLEAMLLRERRVDLSCFLFEADREIARVPGSPYLEQFPTRAEDLFGFDLVILGDIDPGLLNESLQDSLSDYVVTSGGALVVVAGKRFMPEDYRRSVLARLLPVELAASSIETADAVATKPIQLELSAAGRRSVMLQLSDEQDANDALWQELPPVYWTARVARAKPAAEVLVSHDAPAEGDEPAPVVAIQRYGSGEVLFIGTDNFWRWRRNVGDRYHAVLWGQIIQRMAGARLLTENPRLTLEADQRRYRPGDRIQVFARLFGPDWKPQTAESLSAVLVSREQPEERREVILRAVPGQPAMYRAEFSARKPGRYRLALPGDEIATLDFTVRKDEREYSRASMNEPLLRELADRTNGVFLPLSELHRLPDLITERTSRFSSFRETDIWSTPLFFILLMLLLSGEWIVRKVSELK